MDLIEQARQIVLAKANEHNLKSIREAREHLHLVMILHPYNPMQTQIPSEAAYRRREKNLLADQLDQIRNRPLSEKRKAQENLSAALTNPAQSLANLPWLFKGDHGDGAKFQALDLLKTQQGTRWRKILELWAALELGCPEGRTCAVLRIMGDKQITAVRLAVEEQIEKWEESEKEQNQDET